MSKDYIVFDKNGDSVRVASFRGEGFCTSEPFCGVGKELVQLGFGALEDAKLSRALSLPLVEEFSSPSCEGGGENSEEIDALENLESTAESSEVEVRVRGLFKILRDMVGPRESMDAVDVFDQTIRYLKKLQMELRCNFH